jgi:ATP-dependent Clp endopeptidase proteolytic subunit ClpP
MADDAKKTKEELAKIKAETKRVEAEIKKLDAETETAHHTARLRKMEADKKEQDWRRDKATDQENMIYRFNTIVDKTRIYDCMHTLTQWSRRHPACDIEIVFSSGGGSIVDGFVLFDFIQELRARGHKVTTGSLGMAASMAGVLLQAGEHRWMGHQAWMMIHRAAFGAVGKTFEIEDEVAWIKRIESRILEIFEKRSELTKLKIKRNWDRKDWWISSDEALELGLIDEIKGKL